MNEPIGRLGSCRPARARRTAVETASTASSLADHALGELLLHAQQLVALALQHLVDGNAGPARDDLAIWSGVTASSTIAPLSSLPSIALSFFSRPGITP